MFMLSEAGEILNSYTYDPFGNIMSRVENKPCVYKYHGQQGMMHMEEELSVTAYKLGQRIYAPVVGQFINKAPLWIPGKWVTSATAKLLEPLLNFTPFQYANRLLVQ